MDFVTGMRVTGSGMSANRMRLNTIASNLANINTTRTPEGGPYRRKDVVFEAVQDARSFGEILTSPEDVATQRVQVADVLVDRGAPLLKFEPNHPEADENGNVAYPNIDLMTEMTNMIQATRAYEANVSAMSAVKDMAITSLEIGR
ncbi:MAG: flagellar basal body rod protein FlgC [Pseudomonadota bacterium]|nr:flagellar basal body rod protein FlgC [Pseudomonadota bacterium]